MVVDSVLVTDWAQAWFRQTMYSVHEEDTLNTQNDK